MDQLSSLSYPVLVLFLVYFALGPMCPFKRLLVAMMFWWLGVRNKILSHAPLPDFPIECQFVSLFE